MIHQDVLQEVLATIDETFELEDEVGEDTLLSEVCVDDVDTAMLRDALQTRFAVTISDEDAEAWESVGDVSETVEDLLTAR